jgi:hypothetical protein
METSLRSGIATGLLKLDSPTFMPSSFFSINISCKKFKNDVLKHAKFPLNLNKLLGFYRM